MIYTVLIAFLLSTLIAVTYEKTFRGLSYSRNYVQSLIMSAIVAATIMQAIGDSLASPNMMLDLRIPQNQRYQQIVLDTAIARMLAGELTPAEAAEVIHDGWEEITEELGRETQKAAYRASLGLSN